MTMIIECRISCAKVRATLCLTVVDLIIALGGDFLKGDGTGSFSIYGDKFPVR